MDHRERFLEIRDFLKPYQRIWQNEIMLQYPAPIKDYPIEWIEDLRRFQDKTDVIRLEKKDVFDYITNPDLIAFYQRIHELITLPKMPAYPAMPEDPWTWLFMIPKKQHEIRKLAPHLNHLYHTKMVKQVVDVGGGIGLLAQTLNNQFGLRVISVDMNAQFQQTGIGRHEKNAKDPTNKVRYANMKVEPSGAFVNLLEENVMPVGLHTCGRLALDIIRVSAQKRVPAIVNFGCCYHTLDLAQDLQNVSQFARDHEPLWMGKFALTLSCRAHRKMDEKDYAMKLKVKLYRYAIHILFHDLHGKTKLVTLGNSHPKLYDRPFCDYAREQFRRVGIESTMTDDELNAYFANEKLQLDIEQMLAAGLIRNALGRVLELYLLLDRCLYLEEHGYQVELQEFFDEELSPRNIGITAVR